MYGGPDEYPTPRLESIDYAYGGPEVFDLASPGNTTVAVPPPDAAGDPNGESPIEQAFSDIAPQPDDPWWLQVLKAADEEGE